MQDLAELRGASYSNAQSSHKEESGARIESDKKDRDKLKEQLDMHIHPLRPDDHPGGILNTANGQLSVPQVNVDEAVSIGYNQLIAFEKSAHRIFESCRKEC